MRFFGWYLNFVHHARIPMPVEVVLLVAVLLGALIPLAILLYRRETRSRRSMKLQDEEKRLSQALEAQRVTTLRNEALTLEVRERQKTEAKLKHLAYHDPVTGLRNRAYLTEEIQSLLHKGPSPTGVIVLLYIDLDNFKTVNDMLGHRYGDVMLQEIGKRIQAAVRDEDVVARVGGDEFGVLMRNAQSVDRAFRLAQRLLTLIEEQIDLAGLAFTPAASIGLCRVQQDCTSPDVVLRNVDLALYRAKREGGSRVVIFDSTIHEEALATMRAKQEIKSAISNKEFVLFYQPLIDMRDHSIYGVEALIRWNHPRKGIVGPYEFISLMEESGQIVEVGAWGLKQACEDHKKMQELLDGNLVLSVNVSARQLELSDFVSTLRETLIESNIKPASLQLELTESILASETARIGALFQEIRSLGVKIAFDDFGTGYSSLSYMERYPIDTLKIDQTFVRRMRESPLNRDIVRFIVQLAHASGTNVTAEGVETAHEETELLSLGCAIAQGYLFSRPVPLDQIIGLLERGLPNAKKETKGRLFRIPARTEMV
ncbi:MAG: EAL domain-containing protein [Acidobacteriaceae bacterium]|nr:EAL domain-containing protein [Acidobacteriaceae bacterium]